MRPSDRLTEVFDRGISKGVKALSLQDQSLYLIQDFIISYEMGGLSGYLYNRISDGQLHETIAAMKEFGVAELAKLLEDAAKLFAHHNLADGATWEDVLRKCDPDGRIEEISDAIAELDDYGLADSSIT